MDKEANNDKEIIKNETEVTEEESQEETESDEGEKQFDFAGEIKRMESNFDKKITKMQKAIAKDKFKEREEKREEPSIRRQPEESADDFDARYEQKREQERQEERMEMAEAKVHKLTNDPDETKLIMRYVESFGSAGDLDEDIENAYILANKGRIKAQGSQFIKTLQSKNLAGTKSNASQGKREGGSSAKLSQADKQRLEGAGFKQTKPGRYESAHQVAIVNRDGTITTQRK